MQKIFQISNSLMHKLDKQIKNLQTAMAYLHVGTVVR